MFPKHHVSESPTIDIHPGQNPLSIDINPTQNLQSLDIHPSQNPQVLISILVGIH